MHAKSCWRFHSEVGLTTSNVFSRKHIDSEEQGLLDDILCFWQTTSSSELPLNLSVFYFLSSTRKQRALGSNLSPDSAGLSLCSSHHRAAAEVKGWLKGLVKNRSEDVPARSLITVMRLCKQCAIGGGGDKHTGSWEVDDVAVLLLSLRLIWAQVQDRAWPRHCSNAGSNKAWRTGWNTLCYWRMG